MFSPLSTCAPEKGGIERKRSYAPGPSVDEEANPNRLCWRFPADKFKDIGKVANFQVFDLDGSFGAAREIRSPDQA